MSEELAKILKQRRQAIHEPLPDEVFNKNLFEIVNLNNAPPALPKKTGKGTSRFTNPQLAENNNENNNVNSTELSSGIDALVGEAKKYEEQERTNAPHGKQRE